MRDDLSKREADIRQQMDVVGQLHGLKRGSSVSPRAPIKCQAKVKRRRYDTPTKSVLERMVPASSSPVVAVSIVTCQLLYVYDINMGASFKSLFSFRCLQALVKEKKTSRAHTISRSPGMKALIRGAARRSHRTIARQAMTNKTVRKHVFDIMKGDLQKVMTLSCAKSTKSILRDSAAESMSTLSLEKLEAELRMNAPTLFTVLNPCVDVNRKKAVSNQKQQGRKRDRHISNSAVFGVCAAILLRHRNHHMNVIQRMIALIFHNGHSTKQVCK